MAKQKLNPALCLLGALLSLFCCACAQLPGPQSDAVDDYMKAEIAKRHIPGAALIVIQHGQIVKVQGLAFPTSNTTLL